MFYDLFSLVLDTVAGLFAGVLLLRFWMQVVRVRAPQQLAQFTFQLTDWLVKPLRRLIPGIAGFDWASFVGAYLVALLAALLKLLVLFGGVSLAVSWLALLMLAQWIIYGWTALLILEVIFSWVNPHAPLAPLVQALNAPLLRPIRRIMPRLGGLDISPMILFLLLQIE